MKNAKTTLDVGAAIEPFKELQAYSENIWILKTFTF